MTDEKPRRYGITKAVIAYMESHPGKIIHLDDLVEGVGENRNSVTTAINNLIKTIPDRVRRVGQGRYEWLPYAPERAPRAKRTTDAPRAATPPTKPAEPPTSTGLARAIAESERIAAERGGMRWEQLDPTHPTKLADLCAGNVITLEIISHGEAAMLARITNDPNPANNGTLYRLTPFTF